MAEAKNQAAAKPRTRTAKTAPAAQAAPKQANGEAAGTPASESNGVAAAKATETVKVASTPKPAAKPAQPTAQPAQASQPAQAADESGKRISVTIPLDSAVVGVALKAATLPVSAAKKVAQNKNGIPAYVAVGGLAVIGAVEWPVAAVGGLSLAALRRWGPLKPAGDQGSKKSA